MIEALYYKKLKEGIVQCQLCPRFCVIKPEAIGDCRVRKNIDGKLYSLVYSLPCSVAIDPIEKKPLYHFIPGHSSFSIATVGCNFHCRHCQNWEISQPNQIFGEEITPKEIVERAVEENCQSIAYTYTEPTIYYEYVLDCAKLARKKGIKNVTVTNGYINPEPLKELYKYIDGSNVDIKGFTEEFYEKECFAKLKPVLETLKNIHEMKVWFEITNLVIPTLNDGLKEIKEMCGWIKENLGTDYPLHFTAFYPCYKRMDLPPTKPDILLKAREIALKTGLNYVYVGNVSSGEAGNTYCPKCKALAIERSGFFILKNYLKNGKCKCGERIAGVLE